MGRNSILSTQYSVVVSLPNSFGSEKDQREYLACSTLHIASQPRETLPYSSSRSLLYGDPKPPARRLPVMIAIIVTIGEAQWRCDGQKSTLGADTTVSTQARNVRPKSEKVADGPSGNVPAIHLTCRPAIILLLPGPFRPPFHPCRHLPESLCIHFSLSNPNHVPQNRPPTNASARWRQ